MPSAQPSAGQSSPRRSGVLVPAGIAAGLLIALVAALMISGHAPEFRGLVQLTPDKGLIAATAADVTRIEIRSGRESVTLRREAGGWMIDGIGGPVAPAARNCRARRSRVAVHARHRADARDSGEGTCGCKLCGIRSRSAFERRRGWRGGRNGGDGEFRCPQSGRRGAVRPVVGAGTVYLMPRHVGTEWQLAGDMLRRLRGQRDAQPRAPARACCCRCRWGRCGPWRSSTPAS